MSPTDDRTDVIIVGGGVSGLSAAVFTGRARMDTLVFEHGGSILKRNAHLENYPGFPAGIDARLYLEMLEDQVRRSGGTIRRRRVDRIEKTDRVFEVRAEEKRFTSRYVIATSWSDTEYLEHLPLRITREGSKQFIQVDDAGRTAVEGLYAAGRIARQYHQAIVSAGHGAQAALTLLEDAKQPFYHDWTTPEGYFTQRGRKVPPGCEEISREERLRRAEEGRQVLLDYLSEPRTAPPEKHPRQNEDD